MKRNVNVKKTWSHRKIYLCTDLNRSTSEEARLMVFVLCPGSSKNGTGDLNFFKLYLKTLNYYHPQIQKRKVGSNIYFKKILDYEFTT